MNTSDKMPKIKDWRGTAIEVGDVILYAVKHSTSVEVNEAVVKSIGFDGTGWSGNPKPFVTAEWVLSSYCFAPEYDGDITNFRTIKNVKLTNFEGITVVSKHRAPAFSTEQHEVKWSGS